MEGNTLKRMFLLILSIYLLLPLTAGAEPPAQLSHTMTGYSKGNDFVTLNFSLHVKNTGDKKVFNLILSYLPLSIISTKDVSLNIGNLKSQGAVDIDFTLITPMLLNEQEISKQPLFWAGKYTDGGDNLNEFSEVSHIKGAQ